MKKAVFTATFVAAFIVTIALSQESQYVDQETREIKALSAGEIEGYLDARGMGFAKVAELNHYPGPKHVLELDEQLDITDEQRAAVKDSFRRMRTAALELGRQLVDAERELDAVFAAGNADSDAARDRIADIARIQGELRFAHVNAHIEMRDVLTPDQIARYDDLRGYAH